MAALTDNQANQLWCPFARMPVPSLGAEAAINRTEDGRGYGRCLGSGCMAWRKRVSVHARDQREMDDERIGKFEYGGYCGLAGRPE